MVDDRLQHKRSAIWRSFAQSRQQELSPVQIKNSRRTIVTLARDEICRRDWIKVKNPKSPAMNRAKDAFS
jgi:hypothetical protein